MRIILRNPTKNILTWSWVLGLVLYVENFWLGSPWKFPSILQDNVNTTNPTDLHNNNFHAGGYPKENVISLIVPKEHGPHVIAHRGASGYLPEHTLQAYQLAIDQGADYIEPDLVMTKDKKFISRHDVDLSHTTNVAEKAEFRERYRTLTLMNPTTGAKTSISGYFSFDFTLEEIKTLKAKQRLSNRAIVYNDLFDIPTLEDIIEFVEMIKINNGNKRVGIYAEMKNPYFFESQCGFDVVTELNKVLEAYYTENCKEENTSDSKEVHKYGRNQKEDPASVYPFVIQAFDNEFLANFHEANPYVPLVQLLNDQSTSKSDSSIAARTGRSMVYNSSVSLLDIADYAHAIAPTKFLFSQVVEKHLSIEEAVNLVSDAHDIGLAVVPWTFKREYDAIDPHFDFNAQDELDFFITCLGVDGVFVEHPDQVNTLLSKSCTEKKKAENNQKSNSNGTTDYDISYKKNEFDCSDNEEYRANACKKFRYNLLSNVNRNEKYLGSIQIS